MIVLLKELFTVSRVHENNINLINSSPVARFMTLRITLLYFTYYLELLLFEKVKNRVFSHLLLVYNLQLTDSNNDS